MKEIVKVLLAEGIDEETIHEVLDVIEANYDPENSDITYHKSVRRHADKEVKKGNAQYKKDEKELDKALHKSRIAHGDLATLQDLNQYYLDKKPGSQEHQNVQGHYVDQIKKTKEADEVVRKAHNKQVNTGLKMFDDRIRRDEAQRKVHQLTK